MSAALLRASALRQKPLLAGSSSRPSLLVQQHVRLFAKPAKAKEAKTASNNDGVSADVNTGDKTYKMVIAALDAPITKPPPASKEEMERRAKVGREYGVGMFERHNEEEHILACRIRLKNHAIDMLPKNSKIRTAALETDEEGPPSWRAIPVWTPPIEGFDPDDYLESAENEK